MNGKKIDNTQEKRKIYTEEVFCKISKATILATQVIQQNYSDCPSIEYGHITQITLQSDAYPQPIHVF